uniref:Uncharacterized sensor-like histidine kinase ycf26 n=1 Tax=Cyanidium sp. THAL103 TaxID=3027999 RepID=A0A9Y1MXT6_9RHOD|nr:hypothetical protein CspTHAL103_004 [Cyanidium sp. THAL103]
MYKKIELRMNLELYQLRQVIDEIIKFSNNQALSLFYAFLLISYILFVGASLNASLISLPIHRLLIAMKDISAGNFREIVISDFDGILGKTIASFNTMINSLQNYEYQNLKNLIYSKFQMELLLNIVSDGIIILNSNLEIILMNNKIQQIFQLEKSLLVLSNINILLPSNIVNMLNSLINQVGDYSENDFIKYKFNLHLPDKNIKILKLLANICCNKESVKNSRIIVVIKDVTKESQLDLAKSQFISNVSHELRTPLFNIKSFIETLEDYYDVLSDEEKINFLYTIHKETDRLTRVVNNVLNLSKLESRNICNFDSIFVGNLINDTLLSYTMRAKSKYIKIYTHVEKLLPEVKVNYELLIQALSNLVDNAIKFSYFQGSISIRIFTILKSNNNNNNNKVLRVEISDNGIGINHDNYLFIFNRFSRIENQVHALEGTGLGLSIVNDILFKHKSRIYLCSQIDLGTTFWFDLIIDS